MNKKIKQPALTKLAALKFRFLLPDNSYIVIHEAYERFGRSEPKYMVGTSEAIYNLLKKVFDYKSFLSDEAEIPLKDNNTNFKKFLKYCEDLNGDGFDNIEVFKLPLNK